MLMHYQLDAQVFASCANIFFLSYISRELLWVFIGTKSGLRNIYYLSLWTLGLRKREHSERERSSIQSVFLEVVGDGGENTNSIVNRTWASGYDSFKYIKLFTYSCKECTIIKNKTTHNVNTISLH